MISGFHLDVYLLHYILYFTISNPWKMISGLHLDVYCFTIFHYFKPMENDFWFSSRRLSASLYFTISNPWK